MSRRIKNLGIILVMIMVIVAVFAGCNNDKKSTEPEVSKEVKATEQKQTEESQEPVVEEPLDITWLGLNPNGVPMAENTVTELYLEEKFNVNLTAPNVDQFNNEQWNLYWASGNTADLICSLSLSRTTTLMDQELIRPVTSEMVEGYLPTWMAMVRSIIDPEVIEKQITFDGDIYLIPYANRGSDMTYIAAIRSDWLRNVGIDHAPTTLDEFEEVLKRFTEDDPDGNGIDDTYGFEPEPWCSWNYIYGAFGTNRNSFYVDENDQVYYTPSTDDYKNFLKKISSWVKAGYIDPEFITDKRDAVWSKFADSKIGISFDHGVYFASTNATGPTGQLKQKNPDAEVEYFGAIKGPDGRAGGFASYPSAVNYSFSFGADTSDEKVVKIMTMMDTLCSDFDHYVNVHFGEENVSFTIDENGIYKFTEEYSKPDKQAEMGINQFYGMIPTNKEYADKVMTSPVDVPMLAIAYENPAAFYGTCFVYSGTNESYGDNISDVAKVADEFYYNAASGVIDIDAEWDLYLDKLQSAGIEEIVAEFQELYEASN